MKAIEISEQKVVFTIRSAFCHQRLARLVDSVLRMVTVI